MSLSGLAQIISLKVRKLPKSEIVEYLSQNDPRLNIQSERVAPEGLTGGNDNGRTLFENRDIAVEASNARYRLWSMRLSWRFLMI